MNVHHLYFMLQGLVALYFVTIAIPSVGVIIYQAPVPSSSFPTYFTDSQPSKSSSEAIFLKDSTPGYNEEDTYILLPVHVDDDGQNLGISSLHTPDPQHPRFMPPPTVHLHREDSETHSILNQHKAPDLLPQQQTSTAVGNSFCFLALSVLLGTLGVRRLIGPRNLPHQDGGNADGANPEWNRNPPPTSILIDELVHNQELEKPFIPKTHAQDIWVRQGGPNIKIVHPISSGLSKVPSAAPSAAYGPSIRKNTKARKAPVPLSQDSHNDVQKIAALTAIRTAVAPSDRLGSAAGAPVGVFGRAPGHIWDTRSPRASKALPISVFKDVQSGRPTCDGSSATSSLPLIPPKEHPAVGTDTRSKFLITAPIKATFYVKPPYINYKKRKAVKPLAVNTLNNFKANEPSTTASSRVQSAIHLHEDQSFPSAVETVPCVTSQTENSTRYLRKNTHVFEDPNDCRKATIPPSIAQPTIGSDNWSSFPVTGPTATTIFSPTRSDGVNFVASPLAANTLDNCNDKGTSTTASPRVQSSYHLDERQEIPSTIETAPCITSQTESRKDAHFFEDFTDCKQATIPSSIVQPTSDSDNQSRFPVIVVPTENTIPGSTSRILYEINTIATHSYDQTSYKHTVASAVIQPTACVHGGKTSSSFPDGSRNMKNTSPGTSISDVVPPLSVDACDDLINDRFSTNITSTNFPTVRSTAVLSSPVTVPLGVCKTPVKHRKTNNRIQRISSNNKPASHSTSVRQPAKISEPEVPRVPEFDDVFYIKPNGLRPETDAQGDTRHFKEDRAELSGVFDHQTSDHDMIIDTTLEDISPIRTTRPSSYPALFGPNAVRFPSAALDLATLIANPPVFAPWKFEELMPAADAPFTGLTGSMDQSSHDMDVDMDYEPYRPSKMIDWSEYDKAFAKQELRWRTIIQSHPPKNNFWSQYPRAPSHRAW